jgi:hypothetical protein
MTIVLLTWEAEAGRLFEPTSWDWPGQHGKIHPPIFVVVVVVDLILCLKSSISPRILC